jgi:hypothetical protein
VAKWLRQRFAKPPFPGSNPGVASKIARLAIRSEEDREFSDPAAKENFQEKRSEIALSVFLRKFSQSLLEKIARNAVRSEGETALSP